MLVADTPDHIVSRYQGLLRHRLRRFTTVSEDARDLAQETFLQAFRNLGRLRHFDQLRAWLLKIAERIALRYRQRKKNVDPKVEPLPAATTPEAVENAVMARELWDAVENLPDPYRLTLIQRYKLDFRLTDIALAQRIRIPLVKFRVRRALELLRSELWWIRESAAIRAAHRG